jgi:hypothetical protein
MGRSGRTFGSFGPDCGPVSAANISRMAISPARMQGTALELAPPPRLNPERCLSLLREARQGYLALSRAALPIVLPVNCAVDGGLLLVRVGPGSFDQAAPQPGVVAFGTVIPRTDGAGRWEVLVQGRAELVHHGISDIPHKLAFVNNSLTVVFRVTLELVTGWEYGPV